MTSDEKKILNSFVNKVSKNKEKIKNSLIEIRDILGNESAETRKMLSIYRRYASGESIDKQSMEKANEQFSDLIKSIGLVGIFALPGGVLAIAFLVKLGKVFDVDILPKKTFDD